MATTNITPAIDPEAGHPAPETLSPSEAIEQERAGTTDNTRNTWRRWAGIMGLGAGLVAAPMAVAQSADIRPAVAAAGTSNPDLVLAAAQSAEKARPMYTVQSVYGMTDENNQPVDYHSDPGYADFEKRFGIPLVIKVGQIQDSINRDRGVVVKEVQMNFVRHSSLRNQDGSYSWGKVVNGLGDARLAPPRPLSTLYAGANDPYGRITNLIKRIANEQSPESYAWRNDLSDEQKAQYQANMATVRANVLDQLSKLNPEWQQAIAGKMIEVLDAVEQQMGQPAPMGFWYRVVVTGGLKNFAELQIIAEQLAAMPATHPNRASFEARRNELLGGVRQFADLSNLLARSLGVSGAMAIRPDLILPDPTGGSNPVTIGHFKGYTPPAGRGMSMSTTQWALMDTGYVALTERLPMITEALRAQRIRQGGLMADTIAELPAQVAALDKWARPKLQWLFYGTESGDRLTERTEKLVAYISDIQAKRPPKLTPEEVRNLIVEGRHEMTEIERALVALWDEKSLDNLPVIADGSAQSIAAFRKRMYDQRGGVVVGVESMRWVLRQLDPDNKITA